MKTVKCDKCGQEFENTMSSTAEELRAAHAKRHESNKGKVR